MTFQIFSPSSSSLTDKFTCMQIHCPVYEVFFLQKIGIYSYDPDRSIRVRSEILNHMDRVKQIWYLSPMRAAKVQASLRIRAVSPEPSLLAHTSSESRGPFRQKARSLAPLNGWACADKMCHDGMLEDTNSLDGAHMVPKMFSNYLFLQYLY